MVHVFAKSFAGVAAVATFAAIAAAPLQASANELTRSAGPAAIAITLSSGVSAAPVRTGARVVNAYRGTRATAYRAAAPRLNDSDGGWSPTAVESVVRVEVEVPNASPSRAVEDSAPELHVLTVRTQDLTAAQSAALQSGRRSDIAAAFPISVMATSTAVQRVDVRQSNACDGDALRCEEKLVFETVSRPGFTLALADLDG